MGHRSFGVRRGKARRPQACSGALRGLKRVSFPPLARSHTKPELSLPSAVKSDSQAAATLVRDRPAPNDQTSRFRTWLRRRCGLRRCRIALLLRRRGVAASMRNARTDIAEQPFGLEVAHL